MKERLRQLFFRPKPEPEPVQPPPEGEAHLVIHSQSAPTRCEICHQSDQLDPASGKCLRCSELPQPLLTPQAQQTPHQPPAPATDNSRWILVSMIAMMAVSSFAYRLLVMKHLEQTSALFMGLPTLIAMILSLTPKAKTVTGMIMKGMTIALLMSAIFLGEGFICILMASPLFYLIGLIIGLLTDASRRRREEEERRNKYGKPMQFMLLPLLLVMCLEGVNSSLSFSRNEVVSEERIVAASVSEVTAKLAERPDFRTELPFYLRLRFPIPVATSGAGLSIGDQRVIHFAGGEGHPGDLVMAVTEQTDHSVKFQAISDQSKIAHWLDWQTAEVEWQPIDATHTRVRWTLRYQRLLDPSWYFGPWERYAVRLSAGYLIDNLATPR